MLGATISRIVGLLLVPWAVSSNLSFYRWPAQGVLIGVIAALTALWTLSLLFAAPWIGRRFWGGHDIPLDSAAAAVVKIAGLLIFAGFSIEGLEPLIKKLQTGYILGGSISELTLLLVAIIGLLIAVFVKIPPADRPTADTGIPVPVGVGPRSAFDAIHPDP